MPLQVVVFAAFGRPAFAIIGNRWAIMKEDTLEQLLRVEIS